MYRYILWDIDGTVLDFLAAEKGAIKKLFLEYGFGECSDEMILRYSKINRKYWEMLERGEMAKPNILVGRFREFFESEGLDVSKAESFNKDYQYSLGDFVAFKENVLEILLEEKDKYVIAAVTNGTKTAQERKLSKSGLDKVFHYIFISEDIGYEKPDTRFFDHVFEAIGVKDKREVLIVGDSLTSDMKGGYLSGIDTCWYNYKNTVNDTGMKLTYEVKRLDEVRGIV